MSRLFEKISDQKLTSLVHDSLVWDRTGILPDGALRIQAAEYRESIPTLANMDAVTACKICHDFALREAAIRWMETQGFKV